MTRDEWTEVERLYHAARERRDRDRAAFVREACGGNQAVRREVESLLDYDSRTKNFMATPAGEHPAAPQPLVSAVRQVHRSVAPGQFVGRAFGSYELTTLIAVGGMGEVYRARDLRLDRIVAVKILPQHQSEDPERRERFQREAAIVSSLNHPHICTLYDIGTHDGLDYLVMEHIDGETLLDRLRRERMSWEDALEYSIQLALALEAAHRQGIVHRDLKPANVMLTRSGLKVLDFGLAARRATTHAPALSRSPEPKGLTVDGRIMGTVPYMAPEQLQGKAADARTDIFAFGVLMYEMAAGRPPFDADSQAALIAAILKDDPEPIGTAVPGVPPLFARTIHRCLMKDPDERWQSASDLLFELRLVREFAGTAFPAIQPRRPSRAARALWLAAVFVPLSAALALWLQPSSVAPESTTPTTVLARFAVFPPEGTSFPASFDVPFALSRDGRHIAYVAAGDDGVTHLWLRRLDSEEHHKLAGTEGATSPFWSPDNQWVGFLAGDSLQKVRITTPITQVIASPVRTMGGAAWSRHGTIVFPGPGGLLSVSEDGGPVSPVSQDKNFRLWPQFLEDGERYIYASFSPRNLLLASLANETPRTLMTFPVNVSALAYVPGFIFFVQDGVLFVRPFDEGRAEFTGAPERVLDGIPVTGPGRAPFSVSAGGVLAFWTEAVGTPAVLRWLPRNGGASSPLDAPAKYFGFSLSPDGRLLAFSRVGSNGGPDVWVHDLDSGEETQLTFDGVSFAPHWSPDGSRILFSGIAERPPPTLFVKPARLAGAPLSLGTVPGPVFPSSWVGDVILSVALGGGTGSDIFAQREGTSQADRLPINTAATESEGRLSPDSRWIAYTTDEAGREEVWVASFPSGTLRRQVSSGGGISPHWCDDGRMVFLTSDKHLISVPFDGSAGRIDVGEQRQLFRVDDLIQFDRRLVPTANYYAATTDCRRFLVAAKPSVSQSAPISVFVNWPSLLAR